MKSWEPLAESHVIRNRSAAKRYARQFQAHLRTRAEALIAKIRGVEDEEQRLLLGFIVEFLAAGHGNFTAENIKVGARGIGHGMKISHFDLDDDALDSLCDRFGEDQVEEAGRCLMRFLHGESSIFVSWVVAPILFESQTHETVFEHRILYNLRTQKFLKVYSHHEWNDPRKVEFRL